MESKRKEGAAIQTKVGRLLKITRISGLPKCRFHAPLCSRIWEVPTSLEKVNAVRKIRKIRKEVVLNTNKRRRGKCHPKKIPPYPKIGEDDW
ncbi:MAG: hypothetical protein DRR19_04950 [Candidatus Parabeggiatoa sp. nov. 1]|nr:MAG: hypothetical protein DRR19_04950 [Gammaproteobacteria bacterium]